MSDTADGALPTAGKLRKPLKSKLPMLGGTVLVSEVLVLYLAVLVGYGLRPVPLGWIIGGAVLITVVCILAMITMPKKAGAPGIGIALGWAVQVLIGLSAIVMPGLLVVLVVFGIMWGTAVYWGRRIDREATAWIAEHGYVQPPADMEG